MKNTLIETVDRITGRLVLIIGDVMLDRYWWGTVSRISPEAPVPVVQKQRSTVAPGGAANVAANVASLGGQALLLGVIGRDDAGQELCQALELAGVSSEYLLTVPGRPTTVKTRIVAHSQHVVRVDEEETAPLSGRFAEQLLQGVHALLPTVDIVVISDYAKGLLTPLVLGEVIQSARKRGIPIVIDPKGRDYSRYNGATVVTPNQFEAILASGLEPDSQDVAENSGACLLSQLDLAAVLVTQGEAGMTLFERGRKPLHIMAGARTVYDVTGAGDTVLAALSLALAAGTDLPAAARLANLAAGMAVEQVGTVPIGKTALCRALQAEVLRSD